jgi:hypothetical protein
MDSRPSEQARWRKTSRRNSARRIAEQHMLEQATLRRDYERLLTAARRVVEAWRSSESATEAGSELDAACSDLAALLD